MAVEAMQTPAPPSERSLREHERIPKDGPLAPYISVDPQRMHGEPCFTGTRVPIQTLFDHLRFGELEDFLDGYPDVTREQAVAVIDLCAFSMLSGLRAL